MDIGKERYENAYHFGQVKGSFTTSDKSKYEEHYITQEGLIDGDYHCPIINGDCIYKNCLGEECNDYTEFAKEIEEELNE